MGHQKPMRYIPGLSGLVLPLVIVYALAISTTPALPQSKQNPEAPVLQQTKPLTHQPSGGGPTGAAPAPTPPAEHNVILPSASGHSNSAAPTMTRKCEIASPSRPGTGVPSGATDPCTGGDVTSADKAHATPEQTR